MSKDICEKPQIVAEAAASQKGMHWSLEIFVYFAVFIVSQIVMGVVMLPVMLVYLFTNEAYLDALKTQDMAAAMAASQKIASSGIVMLTMLFSEILMIVVIFLFCRLLQKRKLRTLGFMKKGAVKEYLIGMAGGFVVFSVVLLLSVFTGGMTLDGITPQLSVGILVLFFIGFMIQGMAEEVMCRGYLMVSIGRRYPMYAAVLINSLIFAALHLGNKGITVLSFLNLTLFGIFASLYFIHRGSIWGIGAFHSVWNFVQGNFYGVKVSGMKAGVSVFASTAHEGKELLNGGAFGLEGSILTTLVLSALIVVLWISLNKKKKALHADGEAKLENDMQ